jgi:hypothetical protein
MTGAEYLAPDTLSQIWTELGRALGGTGDVPARSLASLGMTQD